MTVADNTSRNQYTATSGQTVFAYTFEIVDKDHIVVLQNGTALSEGTDYTVSNVGNDNGGNITLTSGATAGDVMTLYRDMPYSRTQNYTNSGDFLASEVNADFDELWLAGEQTDRSFSQSIRKPITDSDSISMELPEAATRANKFVKFDATGAVDVAGATITVDAEDVSITDAGNYYTSNNVEGALQEVGADLAELDSGNYLSVTDFGAKGDGTTDDTTAIQNAINHASNNEIQTIFFPDGHYKYTTLRLYHDAVDNPNFQGEEASYTGNNSTTSFAYTWPIEKATDLRVKVDGAIQELTTDYTVSGVGSPSGGSVTFNTAPGTGLSISIAEANRDGRFVFLGTGKLGLSDLKNLKTEPSRIYGSILESTSGGSGIIVEPTGTFSGTDARNFRGQSMTFIADNTGYIITSESCPGISFSSCSFKQFNTGGNGLKIRNAWFFTMDQCFVYGPSASGEPAVNTGDGITGATGFFAGLWNVSNCLIDSFSNGIRWTGGTFVNVSVRNTAIQNCNNHGFYAEDGVLQQLLFDNVYQENINVRGRSFIKGTGNAQQTARIRNLRMTSSFMYGPFMTGPLVDLDSVDSIDCEHLYVFRPRQTFLNVTDTKNNQISSGKLENCTFTTDEDVANYYTSVDGSTTVFTGPYAQVATDLAVYVDDGTGSNYTLQTLTTDYTVSDLDNIDARTSTVTFTTAPVAGRSIKIIRPITLLTGIMPSVNNVIYPTVDKGFYFTADPDGSTSRRQFIRLYDETTKFLPSYVDLKGTTGIAKFGFGETVVETITSSPYNISGTAGKTYYDLTHSITGGLAVYISDTGEVNDGRLMIIKNNEASTSSSQFDYIQVYNNSDQSTFIARLSPGQAGLFVMDKQNGNKFRYAGRIFTENLDLADNHKIEFGRGTASGRDMQIYHDGTSGENRIDTLAGLTIDGLTYPTADGTADQVLTTDGSGNLTFSSKSSTTTDVSVDSFTGTGTQTAFTLSGDPGSENNLQVYVDGVYQNKDTFTVVSTTLTFSEAPPLNALIEACTLNEIGSITVPADGSVNSAKIASGAVTEPKIASGAVTSSKLGGDLTTPGNLTVTGSINTVLSVDGTTEDVFITGATPGLEFVENDSGGSRMRMAWNTSGSFSPTLYQSLYGDSTTTYGGINIQTRASDGSGNQVVYAYDPINDRNWWGTRAAGDVAMQLQSDGTFNVRGGNVSFENSTATSDDFYWDASTSRLGLGNSTPTEDLHIGDGTASVALTLQGTTTGTNAINMGDSANRFAGRILYDNNVNDFAFHLAGSERMRIASSGKVGIGTPSPGYLVDAQSSGDAAIRIRSTGTGSSDDSLLRLQIAGTTASNLIAFGDSGNTFAGSIRYVHQFDYMRFDTNATERMRIDSSGNVGIGESAPDEALVVRGGNYSSNQDGGIAIQSGDASGSHLKSAFKLKSNGSGVFRTVIESASGIAGGTIEAISIANNNGFVGIGTGATVPARELEIASSAPEIRLSDTDGTNTYCELAMNAGICTITSRNDTQDAAIRFRGAGGGVANVYALFDANGRFIVGRESASVSNAGVRVENLGGNNGLIYISKTSSGDKIAIGNYHNGTYVGGVNYSDTATSFPTSSDQRLKENIVDAPSASDDIDAIQVRSFDWKADGSHQKYGMVAQELQGVAPEAVTEGDTETDMMGVDYSKLVPMLVKEIQSLRARVAQLEND